ncbi:MAG TPA: hypothetical protein G4N94_00625 [Caldilineae bacterium]|nr:hypothetical protein [Caldilineae bacterium]
MSVLQRLSSAVGDRSEASNKAVASEALDHPELLEEVAVGLDWRDPKLVGDCAEVFTEVAEVNPALVTPYVDDLIPLLDHKTTRVRWETTHALALVAALVPDQIVAIILNLLAKIERDKSTIVRDYAVVALGEYGGSSPERAREMFPHLEWALWQWESKHAKLVLEAMSKLVAVEPALEPALRQTAAECLDHRRANVRKLAKKLA